MAYSINRLQSHDEVAVLRRATDMAADHLDGMYHHATARLHILVFRHQEVIHIAVLSSRHGKIDEYAIELVYDFALPIIMLYIWRSEEISIVERGIVALARCFIAYCCSPLKASRTGASIFNVEQ